MIINITTHYDDFEYIHLLKYRSKDIIFKGIKSTVKSLKNISNISKIYSYMTNTNLVGLIIIKFLDEIPHCQPLKNKVSFLPTKTDTIFSKFNSIHLSAK